MNMWNIEFCGCVIDGQHILLKDNSINLKQNLKPNKLIESAKEWRNSFPLFFFALKVYPVIK